MMKRYEDWLENAKTGDKIMYLQADYAARRPEVSQFFMKAAEEGLVFLYQQRSRPGVFKFYAKRLSKKAGNVLKPWDC